MGNILSKGGHLLLNLCQPSPRYFFTVIRVARVQVGQQAVHRSLERVIRCQQHGGQVRPVHEIKGVEIKGVKALFACYP